MTIYRLWLISLADKKILYSKFFPNLEKKDGYTFPLITAQEFIKCLYISLGIDNQSISTNNAKKTKESNLNISTSSSSSFENQDNFSQYSRDRRSSSSSSCSLSSLSSMMSNTTVNTIATVSRQTSQMDSSTESSIIKEYLCLYNHLPLIVCPLVNMRKQRERSISMSSSSISHEDIHRTSKSGLVDNLILLVYEHQGYLFVCCPRISQKSQLELIKTINHDHCDANEKLLLQEPNISLSYTILHMISSMFFAKNKSSRSMELFITSYMPFGTLIKTKSDQDVLLSSKLYPKDTVISIRLTESLSTSFQSDELKAPDNETIFGTLTLNYIDTKHKSSSKSDIVLTIENLHSCSLTLPTNCCTVANESTIIYDINNRNQYNLNIIHYKTNNNKQQNDNNGNKNYLADRSSNEWKFFQTKYTIHRKSSQIQSSGQQQQQQQSFIDSKNIHHINLTLWINNKISFEDVKFKYFIIKFSLNRGQSKKQVQTIGNSINNLIIRDSIHISQGQLKNEHNSLIWMIGNRLPRTSRKLFIDFDLLITRDNLQNLDTQCTFSHTVQFRMNFHQKSNRSPMNNNNNNNLSMIRNNNTQLYESKIQSPINMIPPYLRLSKIAMIFEPSSMDISKQQQQQKRSAEINNNEYCHFEYNLNSYEYRLYPSIIDSNV